MAYGFPFYIDLHDNNCVVLGGGKFAASRAKTLLKFGAKVTVISPTLCAELRELDTAGRIRYIPRKYYRGDCTSAYLCVAATDEENVNIAIADECKAKGIPVNVSRPAAFGTFSFPSVVMQEGVTLSLSGPLGAAAMKELCRRLDKALPGMIESAVNPPKEETAEPELVKE